MASWIPLAEAVEPSRVGGKAAELGRLSARGLPVPDAFVVPVAVMWDGLDALGLRRAAEDALRQPDLARFAELSRAILASEVPPALAADWVAAATALGPSLAVRSSAVGEDGRATSFAGLHLSRLSVAPEAAPRAILEVWASLFSPEACSYRRQTGARGGAMAVLVQRLVDPLVAGVMFTVNPVTGSWRELVVEAVWGLGDALVGGEVAPHWFLVRRPPRLPLPLTRAANRLRFEVVQQDLPTLTRRRVRSSAGVIDEVLPSELRGLPSLEGPSLRRVARLGLTVEAAMGAPQDVEWAIGEDGRVWLLQARPITASGANVRPRADQLWTRRFLGERWSEPVTPMGWSIIRPVLEHLIAFPKTQARYLGGGDALRLVASRPYVNATAFRHLAFKLPGAPPPAFAMELLPRTEELAWRSRFAAPPDVLVYASFLREAIAGRRWERFSANPLTNARRWAEWEARILDELPGLRRPPIGPLDAIARVETLRRRLQEYTGIHIVSLLLANLTWQLLESALDAVDAERASGWFRGLAVCPAGNRTVEVNQDLWRLARGASDADLDALEVGRSGAAFGEALRVFLDRHGHRGAGSWEVMSPRWHDRPGLLVPALRAARQSEDPALRQQEQERRFAEADRDLGQLPLLQRVALRWLASETRTYLLLRENQRYTFDHLVDALQRALRSVASAVPASAGISADDAAWVTWDELRGAVDGRVTGLGRLVAERRAQAARDALVEPPTFLRGDDEVAVIQGGRKLSGNGISAGRATGRVRVVRSLAEGASLEKGDVLVARATDPSWTPLFLVASAVVLELGSQLSHGAVVAREYGVPCVVNVEGATSILKDGATVTVDGGRGLVWVEPG
jgi:phosphohistidine swiveling domain-containing protein